MGRGRSDLGGGRTARRPIVLPIRDDDDGICGIGVRRSAGTWACKANQLSLFSIHQDGASFWAFEPGLVQSRRS